MNTLPLISIGGTSFYVDVINEVFREYGNPDNLIPFRHLQGDGDHYILAFDKRTRNAMVADEKENNEHIIIAHIPALVKIDPAGLAKKFNKPVRTFMNMKDDTEW